MLARPCRAVGRVGVGAARCSGACAAAGLQQRALSVPLCLYLCVAHVQPQLRVSVCPSPVHVANGSSECVCGPRAGGPQPFVWCQMHRVQHASEHLFVSRLVVFGSYESYRMCDMCDRIAVFGVCMLFEKYLCLPHIKVVAPLPGPSPQLLGQPALFSPRHRGT